MEKVLVVWNWSIEFIINLGNLMLKKVKELKIIITKWEFLF